MSWEVERGKRKRVRDDGKGEERFQASIFYLLLFFTEIANILHPYLSYRRKRGHQASCSRGVSQRITVQPLV